MKILSPAGNFESLKRAVYNGADEVYLGINDFNARNNIDGFSLQTLKSAVDFCHVYGVKVLLAINILFTDGEMQSALDTVVEGYNMGVDAFIVQDLGLISLIYKNYPQIELHASTQMGLHNLEGVRQVANYGVKRVVLARETPLSEIKRIKDNIDIEIEYFAHGALCVSFSGNCYLSSHLLGASGNRGRCKQLCRLPYAFYDGERQIKKGYLLSAKDFNMTKRLTDLKNAGVDVLKIEGRARRPFYVATATRAYRNALDGKPFSQRDLDLAFNRNFCNGYFDGNGDIISDIQNHVGVLVGKVERVNNGKNFNEVFISSKERLSPKSTFKFFSGNQENNTLTAYDLTQVSAGLYRITTTQKINVGDSVRLIVDAEKESQVVNYSIKREIQLKVELVENMPAKAVVIIDGESVEVVGETCLCAIKQPLNQTDIIDNFSKNEYFSVKFSEIILENAFLPKQKLNEFRRKVFERAYDLIVERFRRSLDKIVIKTPCKINELNDFTVVTKFDGDIKTGIAIYSPSTYELDDIIKVKREYENIGVSLILDTPNFALKDDILLLKEIVEKSGVKIVANNYYALEFNTDKIIGFGLNVYNGFTANEYGLPFISAENSFGFVPPFMTLRHCPIKSHVGGDCGNCKYHSGYYYKMDNGKKLQLERKKLSTCTFYLQEKQV